VVDDVGALFVHGLGDLTTTVRSVEAREVRRFAYVLYEHFRIRVGGSDTGDEAGLELADQVDRHATDEADGVHLGLEASGCTDEEGTLMLREP